MLTEVLKEITDLHITLQAYLSVTTESNTINPYESFSTHLSATKAPLKDGKVYEAIMPVDYSEFNEKYNQRDVSARRKMRELVDSDANKVTNVFSTLFKE